MYRGWLGRPSRLLLVPTAYNWFEFRTNLYTLGRLSMVIDNRSRAASRGIGRGRGWELCRWCGKSSRGESASKITRNGNTSWKSRVSPCVSGSKSGWLCRKQGKVPIPDLIRRFQLVRFNHRILRIFLLFFFLANAAAFVYYIWKNESSTSL